MFEECQPFEAFVMKLTKKVMQFIESDAKSVSEQERTFVRNSIILHDFVQRIATVLFAKKMHIQLMEAALMDPTSQEI